MFPFQINPIKKYFPDRGYPSRDCQGMRILDNQRAIFCHNGLLITILSLSTGQVLQNYHIKNDIIRRATFTRDGNMILYANKDYTSIYKEEFNTNKRTLVAEDVAFFGHDLILLNNDKWLLYKSKEGLCIIDLETKEKISKIDDWITTKVNLLNDGNTILLFRLGAESNFLFLDSIHGRVTKIYKFPKNIENFYIYSCIADLKGNKVIIGRAKNSLSIHSLDFDHPRNKGLYLHNLPESRKITTLGRPPSDLLVSNDGRLLVTAVSSYAGLPIIDEILFWNLEKFKLLGGYIWKEEKGENSVGLGITKDQKELVFTLSDRVLIFDLKEIFKRLESGFIVPPEELANQQKFLESAKEVKQIKPEKRPKRMSFEKVAKGIQNVGEKIDTFIKPNEWSGEIRNTLLKKVKTSIIDSKRDHKKRKKDKKKN